MSSGSASGGVGKVGKQVRFGTGLDWWFFFLLFPWIEKGNGDEVSFFFFSVGVTVPVAKSARYELFGVPRALCLGRALYARRPPYQPVPWSSCYALLTKLLLYHMIPPLSQTRCGSTISWCGSCTRRTSLMHGRGMWRGDGMGCWFSSRSWTSQFLFLFSDALFVPFFFESCGILYFHFL